MVSHPMARRVLAGCVVVAGVGGGIWAWQRGRHAAHRPTVRSTDQRAARPAPPPKPNGKIRIGLESLSGGNELTLKPRSGAALLEGGTGRRLAALPAGKPVQLSADFGAGEVVARSGKTEVRGRELVFAGGMTDIGRRHYPGRIHASLAGSGLMLVDEMEIEQYLQGVLPGELPLGYLPEAQKALAVAARTYALVQHGKHGAYDLCDGTDCQMYVGYRPDAKRGLAAVKATRHLCLWDRDQLVYAFYSADCGGVSTVADEVPLKDKPANMPLPYLQVVRDAPEHGPDFCCSSPYHQWTRRLKREKVEERLNRREDTYVGTLAGLAVTAKDASGRITGVRLRGEAPATLLNTSLGFTPPNAGSQIDKTVTGWALRRALGGLTLKSTLFTIDQPEPDTYRFTGSGFGHGLGLCQIGANGMAKQGYTYRQILRHYYPGTRLALLPNG